MYRSEKNYFFFIAILVFAIQNAGAISFKTEYKVSANNQQLGTLKRTVNREGYVLIDLNFMPLPEPEASDNRMDFTEMVMPGKTLSLNSIFLHLQLLLSGSSPTSASPTANNKISMTLIESTGQSNSITYSFLGQTCHFSESRQSDHTKVSISGQDKIYSSNPNNGFQVQPLAPIISYSVEDEGLEQSTTIQNSHIEDTGSLFAAALSDAHGEEVVGQYFLLGQHFEQLLTALVEGENNNSGLLNLQSIFPILVIPPDQHSYKVIPAGYGQVLTYDSANNMITQQDPTNDPNPCGVITTYQLNSDGSIASIVISEGVNEVTFTSEEVTQSSEDTKEHNSSDISTLSISPATYSLPLT